MASDATMRAYLEPILDRGLDVVFVGVAPKPGGESLRLGHYYADPGNAFWPSLKASGWTSRVMRPDEDATTLSIGIGLDDVYSDPVRLRKRLEKAGPRAVCFNSSGALARFMGVEPRQVKDWRGEWAGDHVSFDKVAVVWAVPDSSGLATRYRDERISLLCLLRERLRRPSAGADACPD